MFLFLNFHIIFNSQIKAKCFHDNDFDASVLRMFFKW